MSKDILLISELKNQKMLKIDVLMKKCYIDDVDALVENLFKIFNKEVKHITSCTVFSDKSYLTRIFEYVNVIIRQEDCNLLNIKSHLDTSSRKIQEKFTQCSQKKYTKFFNRMYLSIQKSMIYIKEQENSKVYQNEGIDLIGDTLDKLNNFILTITPSKTFNPNFEEYDEKCRVIFKNALCDENLSKDEVIERLKESITKIEDKKLMIKGLPHCRKVKKFLNQLKNTFESIINGYKKVDQKNYKYTNTEEVIN